MSPEKEGSFLAFPLITELETRLELATYALQVRCAANCATPASPVHLIVLRQSKD